MTAIDTLTQAAAILDRWESEATPLPWRASGGFIEQSAGDYADITPCEVDCGAYCLGGSVRGMKHADVRLIASAVSALLADSPGSVRRIIRDAIDYHDGYVNSGEITALALSNFIIELDKEQS